MTGWMILLGLAGTAAVIRLVISSPTRMARIQRLRPEMPDAGYLGPICLLVALLPVAVASETTTLQSGPLANSVWAWACAWCALGCGYLLFPIPVPRWLVPKVYRNDTEHVYCRPVIGLKRVETLTPAPEPVADDADERPAR